jgi:hypothetical protein
VLESDRRRVLLGRMVGVAVGWMKSAGTGWVPPVGAAFRGDAGGGDDGASMMRSNFGLTCGLKQRAPARSLGISTKPVARARF